MKPTLELNSPMPARDHANHTSVFPSQDTTTRPKKQKNNEHLKAHLQSVVRPATSLGMCGAVLRVAVRLA